MEKYEWKVEPVGETTLTALATALEDKLNSLTSAGYEIERLEVKDLGILLVGKKPKGFTVRAKG